jgi:hypothetical protein
MDHVVYLDTAAAEMANLISGKKTMIVRGATGRKMPYGRVNPGDQLYFLNNDGEGWVRAAARVKGVLNSAALSGEEAVKLIVDHQDKLQLSAKQTQRWGGKRYLILIEVEQVETVAPFQVDKSNFGNMDDWLPVGDIAGVRLPSA